MDVALAQDRTKEDVRCGCLLFKQVEYGRCICGRHVINLSLSAEHGPTRCYGGIPSKYWVLFLFGVCHPVCCLQYAHSELDKKVGPVLERMYEML